MDGESVLYVDDDTGLFYSKLSYCLPLFTNTWGLDSYRDERTRFTSYTKEDNRRLQVIQNQVSRLLVPLDPQMLCYKQNLPTEKLLDRCGTLSVHQLGAPRTLVMLKKILSSQRPGYVAEKLESRPSTPSRSGETITQLQTDLSEEVVSYIGEPNYVIYYWKP